MEMHSVDVLIIGGGMAGIGCAAALPEGLRVAVLEAEAHCGCHATGRSAAAWIAGYGGAEIRALTRDSFAALSKPPSEWSEASFLAPRGEMLVACTDDELRALESHIEGTPGLEEISLREAQRRIPILDTSRVRRAAFTDQAFDIDADRLLHAWLRQLKARDTPVHTVCGLEQLERDGQHWRATASNGAVFRSPLLVNAAGAWADQVATLAGLAPLGLVPHRRSAALIPAPLGQEVRAWPIVVSAQETWYARPSGGQLMVSPADETPVEPHDAYAEDMTIAEGLDRFEQAVTISVERVVHTWAGLRTFASDRVPVVGPDPRAEGFFWLAGQGGYGIQTAPALSALAAGLVAGRPVSDVQTTLVAALSPARLLKG